VDKKEHPPSLRTCGVKPFFDGKAFTDGQRASDTHHPKECCQRGAPSQENGREVNCRRDSVKAYP